MEDYYYDEVIITTIEPVFFGWRWKIVRNHQIGSYILNKKTLISGFKTNDEAYVYLQLIS